MNRRRRPLALAIAAVSVLAVGTAIAGPPVPSWQATAKPYPSDSHAASYKTFDASGRVTGAAKWHWTSTGGNCCEVYVASAGKRLLEYGGSLPFYSDDAGKTWTQIDFVTPLVNGEGALVGGPGGDIFGIGWDPYSGDHLQAVKYTAKTKKWEVAEAPLKTPFFDREWITYAKGPFTLDGTTYPYVTIVRGGTATKQVELISGDGLSYTSISNPNAEAGGEPVRMTIPVVKNPAADDWQPNPGTYTVPLNAGGVLLLNNSSDSLPCTAARLNANTTKWECVTLPFVPKGVLRQDSRGWLTMVDQTSKTEIELKLSRDGGRTWKSTVLTTPNELKIDGGDDWFDIKVNGKLGQAVIGTRANDKQSRGQDLAWRIDISKPQPRLMQTYAVGKGDIATGIGVVSAADDRFDFPSIALLPDGRIAMSFDDSTTPKSTGNNGIPIASYAANPAGHSPAVAILDRWRR